MLKFFCTIYHVKVFLLNRREILFKSIELLKDIVDFVVFIICIELKEHYTNSVIRRIDIDVKYLMSIWQEKNKCKDDNTSEYYKVFLEIFCLVKSCINVKESREWKCNEYIFKNQLSIIAYIFQKVSKIFSSLGWQDLLDSSYFIKMDYHTLKSNNMF